MFVYWKMVHQKYTGTTWESTETVLGEVRQPMVRLSLGEQRDSFSFNLTNFNNKYGSFFNIRDRIKIYRAINTTTVTESDLLMVGTLKNVPVKLESDKNEFKLQGYNLSEILMEAVTFADPRGLTIPEALALAVQQTPGNNFGFSWSGDNPTVNSEGQPFPVALKRYYYSPLKQIFEELSTSQATQDGQYYYFVTIDNEVVWKRGNQFGSDTFNSQEDLFVDLSTDIDAQGIRNFIIVKGGLDPVGNQIQVNVRNDPSMARNGIKFQYRISQNNQAKLFNKEDLVKSYGTDEVATTFPDFTGGFTTAWTSSLTATVDGINMVRGSPVLVNKGTQSANEKAYVAVLRAHVIKLLEEEGDEFLQMRQWGKYKVDIGMKPGNVSWGLGQQITAVIPEEYEGPKVLRVVDIQYTDSVDTYSLEEDIGTGGLATDGGGLIEE